MLNSARGTPLAAIPDREESALAPIPASLSQAAWPRRAVIWGLGTVLVFLNAFVGAYIFVVVQALLWTQTSLLRGPVVCLLFLMMANRTASSACRIGRYTPSSSRTSEMMYTLSVSFTPRILRRCATPSAEC